MQSVDWQWSLGLQRGGHSNQDSELLSGRPRQRADFARASL